MKNSIRVTLSLDENKETTVGGVGRSKAVRIWLTQNESNVTSQMISRGFEQILMPWRVGAWVQIGMYLAPKSKAYMSSHDADNAYTTIQETWKGTIMDDDRQIVDYHVSERTIRNRISLYSVAFIYAIPPDQEPGVNDNVDLFLEVYNRNKDKQLWELLQRPNPSLKDLLI